MLFRNPEEATSGKGHRKRQTAAVTISEQLRSNCDDAVDEDVGHYAGGTYVTSQSEGHVGAFASGMVLGNVDPLFARE